MRLLQRRSGTRSHALRRVFQAPRNPLARRIPRQRTLGHRRGAVQEHPALVLSECQSPRPQTRRYRRRRGRARTRHRNRLADRRPRRPPDAAHGIQPLQRRIQEDLPQGQTLRHRTLAGGHRPRTRNDDRRTPDRRRHGSQHEDRRRRIPGRQDQGHLLLHRRRTRRLPRTDQGLRRAFPHPHRDEADRRPAGGRTHRRTRRLRPRAVLRLVDVELFERHDRRRPRAGHLAQPPEARRAVLEAQMLHDVRVRHLCRRPQGVPAAARTVADRRRRVVPGQERRARRDDDLLVVEGDDGQCHDASRLAREGDPRAEPAGQEGRAVAARGRHPSSGRGADLPFRRGQHHALRPGQAPQTRRQKQKPQQQRAKRTERRPERAERGVPGTAGCFGERRAAVPGVRIRESAAPQPAEPQQRRAERTERTERTEQRCTERTERAVRKREAQQPGIPGEREPGDASGERIRTGTAGERRERQQPRRG